MATSTSTPCPGFHVFYREGGYLHFQWRRIFITFKTREQAHEETEDVRVKGFPTYIVEGEGVPAPTVWKPWAEDDPMGDPDNFEIYIPPVGPRSTPPSYWSLKEGVEFVK